MFADDKKSLDIVTKHVFFPATSIFSFAQYFFSCSKKNILIARKNTLSLCIFKKILASEIISAGIEKLFL